MNEAKAPVPSEPRSLDPLLTASLLNINNLNNGTPPLEQLLTDQLILQQGGDEEVRYLEMIDDLNSDPQFSSAVGVPSLGRLKLAKHKLSKLLSETTRFYDFITSAGRAIQENRDMLLEYIVEINKRTETTSRYRPAPLPPVYNRQRRPQTQSPQAGNSRSEAQAKPTQLGMGCTIEILRENEC